MIAFRNSICAFVVTLSLAMAACQPADGPAERLGKDVDKTAKKIGKQVDKAADKTREGGNDKTQ